MLLQQMKNKDEIQYCQNLLQIKIHPLYRPTIISFPGHLQDESIT